MEQLLKNKLEELKDGNKYISVMGSLSLIEEIEGYTNSIREEGYNLAYRDGKYFWFDEMPEDYYCYWIGDFDEEEGILPVE